MLLTFAAEEGLSKNFYYFEFKFQYQSETVEAFLLYCSKRVMEVLFWKG